MKITDIKTAEVMGHGYSCYVRVFTDQPLDVALHAYLDRRLARSRVR